MQISARVSKSQNRSRFLLLTGVLVASYCSSAVAQAVPQLLPYTVTAVAGGGTYGTTYSTTAKPFTVGQSCGSGSSLLATDTVGDGCLATQVLLSTPRAAAADSEGNLFIVDSNNQSIRRVDAHTGILTTVAGSIAGTPVYPAKGASCASGSSLTTTSAFGDGCLATQIILAAPEGIAVDAQGNVWFTDYTLGSVRKVSKGTGILTTVVNTTGNVGYKADNVAYTKSGILAANGLLYRPYGLTFDTKGNLYIADNYNNVVDVVNLGSSSTTIAGNAIAAGEIFTIAGSGCPYQSTAYTTTLTTSLYCGTSSYYGKTGNGLASTSSTLDSPYQVAVDNSGNIYIADEYPYDVRVINGATGILTTFANSTFTKQSGALARGSALTTTLGSLYGVATDALGNVYIASYNTSPYANYIARVDIATGEIYAIAGQLATAVPTADTAQTGATYCAAKSDAIGDGCPGVQTTFWKPYQPVVDAAGNIYVTDQGDNLIRKISVGTQFPATAVGASVTQNLEIHYGAGDTGSSSSIQGSDFKAGGVTCTLNAADNTTDCILPITFTPTAAGIRTGPITITSAKGLITTIALSGTGLAPVLALDPGTQSTLASTGLTSVNGIAFDSVHTLVAAVPSSSSVVAVSTVGGVESNVGTGLANANAVAIDGAGNVYAALSSGRVVEVPANGASQVTVGSGFTTPSGLAVDSFGNLFVADSAAKTVSEILAGTGAQITLPIASLSGPTGLAVDSYGNIFVADSVNNNVIELPFNGSGAVTLGSGLSAPTGVAVDPAGSLYVTDKGNKRIVFIPNENGTLNTLDQLAIITGLGSPSGLAVAGSGTIYVSDSSANAIYTFTRNAAAINLGNALTAIGNQSAATLTAPADIISMGTQAAAFGSVFATSGGSNPADFGLSPSSIPASSYFPSAGFGVALTASFTPGALGSRSATYTFGSTSPTTQPTLALSGSGIQPHDSTITGIATSTPGGTFTYGQTVTATITVSVTPGLPTPTGTVSVVFDNSTPVTASLNASGVATVPVTGLSAGAHTVVASYGGDTESSASSTNASFSLAQAPLTVTVNSLNKAFDAPLPTLTGVLTGTQNGDQIGVSYNTTATVASVVGSYPITATVNGSALANYTVNYVNGTLSVTQDNTVTTVSASATSVNSTTQVTLTATVVNQTAYTLVTAPTGSVTFYNTVGTTTTKIGTATLNSGGVATYTTTFPVTGASTSYTTTAVYSGDPNFVTSTSAGANIVSGVPTFGLTSQTTNSLLTVAPGQSGLTSFTLTPAYGYNGTISFACTGSPSPVSCSFSPSTITANGTSTPSLIALTINSTAASSALEIKQRPGVGRLPITLAALPGLALLFGFGGLRRKFLRGYRSLLLVALCLIGLGLSSCGGSKIVAGTPAGADTVTVVATGTGGSFAGVTQQFTVTLNVQ